MLKRRHLHPAERRQFLAGIAIACTAFVGLGFEIAYMVTAVPF